MTTLAIALLALSPAAKIDYKVTIGGVERTAIIHVPAASSSPAPLVFVFHGHGGTSRFSERKYPIHDMWPESVSIHPQGLPTKTKNDPEGGRPGWQNNEGLYGDRDLKLFEALLTEARKLRSIDPNRIYVTGHSNGARFTYLVWSKHPKLFAATAPLAATGTGLISKLSPISTFVLAGEKDPLVDFRGQKLSLELLKSNYAFTNKSPEKVDGYAVYKRADNGATVVSYIHPGGHEVSKDAFQKVIAFFKNETRKSAN